MEAKFLSAACERGIPVAKPWGESKPYDFIVEMEGTFLRIQVKSTRCLRRNGNGNGYTCSVRGKKPYACGMFDFVAAYVIPVDVWYILPSKVAVTGTNSQITLSPGNRGHKYEPYMEAWHLLLPTDKNSEVGDSATEL